MRKRACIVLLIVLMSSFLFTSIAVATQDLGNTFMPGGQQAVQNAAEGNDMANVSTPQGSWVEKLLAAPIDGFAIVLQSIGMKGYDELIFNEGSEDLAIPPYITNDAWDVAQDWFNYFYFAAYGLVFLAILFTGFKISLNAYNPKAREETQKAFMRWVYAFLIMWGATLFLSLLIDVNNAGVELCKFAGQDLGILNSNVLNNSGALGDSFLKSIDVDNILALAILKLGYLALLIYFNLLYIVRDLVLLGLYAFTPFLVWMWAINNNETALKTWFGESLSVIFMQFVHAFGLVFFISISSFLPWWGNFVALATIIPFTKMIRNIFQGFFQYLGVNEEQVAGGVLGSAGSLLLMSKLGKKPMQRAGGTSGGNNGTGSTGGNPTSGNPMGANTTFASTPMGLGSGNSLGSPKTPYSPLASASQWSPKVATAGKALGTVAGLAMAAPLSTVNPMLGGAMMMGARSAGEKIGGIGTNATILGKSVAQNTVGGMKQDYQQGGLSQAFNPQNMKSSLAEGINKAAAIKSPIDTAKYPGYTGMPYTEERPDSTKQAVKGLTMAVLSSSPMEGYKKSTGDPMQWK